MIPVLIQSRAAGASGIVACRSAQVLRLSGLDGDRVRVRLLDADQHVIEKLTFIDDEPRPGQYEVEVPLNGSKFVWAEHFEVGKGCVSVELI